MRTTTSKKFIELLESSQVGSRPDWWERDDNARKINQQQAKKEMIEDLGIDPNAPINYKILEGYQKPAILKSFINDNMQMFYIIITKNNRFYMFNEEMKEAPHCYYLGVDWIYHAMAESKIRKEAKKIIVFTQDIKYIKAINKKREKRQELKNKINLKERFKIVNGNFNKYRKEEEQQEYNIIHKNYKNYVYKKFVYKKDINIYVDKSGYIKETFKNELKNRFNTFKLDNAEKRLQPKKAYYKKLLNEKAEEIENFFIKECNKITSIKELYILENILNTSYMFKGFKNIIEECKKLSTRLYKMASYWGGRLNADELEKDILKILNLDICKEYENNKHLLKVESCLGKYVDNIEDYNKKEDFKKEYLKGEWCASIIIKKRIVSFDSKYIYFYKDNNINYDFKICIED